jgi:periplasmic divalent cation tolerance protein
LLGLIFALLPDGNPILPLATPGKQYYNAQESTRISIRLSMAPTDIMIVLTTAPSDERAEAWARTLVEERLAACVNIHGPMVSFYRWKGIVERDAERQVVIKTTRENLTALRARLSELHSYELPEFLVLTVEDGSDEYLKWVVEQTQQS